MIELRRRYSKVSTPSGGGRLPAEYQEVEYLQGNKKAFINLNTILQKGDYIRFTCTHIDSIAICVGTIDGEKRVGVGWNQKYLLLYYNNTYNNPIITNADGGMYTIEYKWNDKFSVALYNSESSLIGEFKETSTIDFIEKPLYLFACNNNSVSFAEYNGKIYKFELYRNNGRLLNLIPCYRKEDDVAGMYDLVSGEFYTNAGTGEFLVGQDVGVNAVLPSEYQRVEWLGNGEQDVLPYIMTEIYP